MEFFPFVCFMILIFFAREYSSSLLQSARIARSRESNLDSCRPMSQGSYRLKSRRDLQTANKVCGLYPLSPERETCCILSFYRKYSAFPVQFHRNCTAPSRRLTDFVILAVWGYEKMICLFFHSHFFVWQKFLSSIEYSDWGSSTPGNQASCQHTDPAIWHDWKSETHVWIPYTGSDCR